MAKYKVTKVPLTDLQTKKRLAIGDIVERNVKDVEAFEKANGKGYLKRVEEKTPKKVGD